MQANNSQTWAFELDTIPPFLTPAGHMDFSGRVVNSFTQRPLFAAAFGSSFSPGLVEVLEPSEGGSIWTVQLHPSAQKSDETPFTLHDLCHVLDRHRLMKSGPLGYLLSTKIKKVSITQAGVEIRLKDGDYTFPAMLGSDLLRIGSPSAAGYYRLGREIGPSRIYLEKTAIGQKLYPRGPDRIRFRVTEDPNEGVDLFKKGVLDATSNPNLPPDHMSSPQLTPFLRQGDMLLMGALVFVSPRARSPQALQLRKAIASSVNRDLIAAGLEGVVVPLATMTDLWESSPHLDAYEPEEADGRNALRIGYADYFPNGEIVRRVCMQVSGDTSVQLMPEKLAYTEVLDGGRSAGVDVLYTLLQPIYDDPVAILSAFSPFFSDVRLASQAAFRSLLRHAEMTPESHDRLAICRKAEACLQQESFVIPLVKSLSRCLVSPRADAVQIDRNGVFHLGQNS